MTKFESAKLKGITASLKAGEITLTATVPLSDLNMAKAHELQRFLNAEIGDLGLEITPRQLELPAKPTNPFKDPDAIRKG